MQRIHSKQQNLIYHDERITHTIVTLTTQVLPIRRLTDKSSKDFLFGRVIFFKLIQH